MPPKKGAGRGGRNASVTSAPKSPTSERSKEDMKKDEQVSDCDSDTEEEREADRGKAIGFSPCGKSKKQRFICSGGVKVCGSRITTGEDSVMCDVCKEWYHPGCQGLSSKAFEALSEHINDFLWLCMNCKPNLVSVIQVGKGIEKRLEDTERKIIKVLKESRTEDSCRKQIEDRISNMETKLSSEIREKQEQIKESLNKQGSSTEGIKRLIEAKFEKEKRQQNIILHNIKESSAEDAEGRVMHDTEVFEKVVGALLGKQDEVEVEKIYRLGKRPDGRDGGNLQQKPRLMLVRVKNKEQVDALIKRRTQLKDRGFPNVYLTRDLSHEEREVQKKLRAELEAKGKDTHVIFQGRVIQRK